MEARRWVNQSQPQTLFSASLLLYINAAFAVLVLLASGGGTLTTVDLVYFALTIVGGAAAGWGIANERKWEGYVLGLIVALTPFVLRLLFSTSHNPFGTTILTLLFEIALVALLLHPQSREYARTWFK